MTASLEDEPLTPEEWEAALADVRDLPPLPPHVLAEVAQIFRPAVEAWRQDRTPDQPAA